MVFTPTNLFKGIFCPYATQCSLTNCIFSHDQSPKDSENPNPASSSAAQTADVAALESPGEPALKRRKITYARLEDKPPSRAEKIRSELATSRRETAKSSSTGLHSEQSLSSLTRSVTPPPTNGTSRSSQIGGNIRRTDKNNLNNIKATSSSTGAEVKEGLNPRLVSNDPVGHAKRSLYLKHLHAEMVRLNSSVSDAAAMLSEQQLIKMALDEEEGVAKEQPLVYANIVKQRIALYKKMKADAWTAHVKAKLEKDKPKLVDGRDAKPIHTGLSAKEELLILPYLVANQTGLEKFGYVTSPPTDVQIAEATAAVEASMHFEVCDRCSARFQVFPDRSSDGHLTSNGPCRHHPNKKVFPHKTKGDIVSGLPKEPYYPCCNHFVGSPGCTQTENHVFKTSSAARLAATLPFITTPENDTPAVDQHGQAVNAVTFDCEMGYTTQGLELIRLTAVSWPSGDELVDVLVRPLGTIIDLNSRFSGVWPETFSNAIPYSQFQASNSKDSSLHGSQSASPLPIVDDPQSARALLCSFLTPKTPLIGHAIDNDLNTVRLCHPSIIDTVLLWPHPRGLPIRYGLKMLSSNYLDRRIQTGGDRGHDSLEDAQATGDLVRFKIGERWKVLHSTGWRIEGDQLVPPETLLRSEADGQVVKQYKEQTVADMVAKIFDGQAAGKKRRKKRAGSGGGENTEDEELPLGNGVAAYLKHATRFAEEGEAKDA